MIYFYIFISIFAVLAIIHLYFCYIENERYRKLTKPFVILSLAVAITFISPENFPYLYIAMYLGAIGDYLLLNEKNKFFFCLGILFFAADHILIAYSIITLTNLISFVPYFVYIIIGCVVVLAGVFGYIKKGKVSKTVSMLSIPYALILLLNTLLSILLIITKEYLLGLLLFGGYLIFIFSDIMVNYTVNTKSFKRQHFYIMLTYIVAQACIVLSLLFCAFDVL